MKIIYTFFILYILGDDFDQILDPSDVPQMRRYRQHLQARQSAGAVPDNNMSAIVVPNEAVLNESLQRITLRPEPVFSSAAAHPVLKANTGKSASQCDK